MDIRTGYAIADEASDLFFNHRHEAYDALFCANDSPPTATDMEAAILDDATQFTHSYPLVCAFFGVTAQQLADDFLYRL